jgi:hypothetical protein
MSCPHQGNIKRNSITSLGLLSYSCKKVKVGNPTTVLSQAQTAQLTGGWIVQR